MVRVLSSVRSRGTAWYFGKKCTGRYGQYVFGTVLYDTEYDRGRGVLVRYGGKYQGVASKSTETTSRSVPAPEPGLATNFRISTYVGPKHELLT